jgi:hypothetical protein
LVQAAQQQEQSEFKVHLLCFLQLLQQAAVAVVTVELLVDQAVQAAAVALMEVMLLVLELLVQFKDLAAVLVLL